MVEILHNSILLFILLLEAFILLIGYNSQLMSDGREPLIGIVLAQQYPIFGTGSKHPVRILHTFCHQIIDKDTDVGLRAREHHGFLSVNGTMRIDARHQSLAGCLFITCSAVHLSGQIEMPHTFRFEGEMQLHRVEIVILDSIARAENLRFLQTRDKVHSFYLDLFGQ